MSGSPVLSATCEAFEAEVLELLPAVEASYDPSGQGADWNRGLFATLLYLGSMSNTAEGIASPQEAKVFLLLDGNENCWKDQLSPAYRRDLDAMLGSPDLKSTRLAAVEAAEEMFQ